MFSCFRSKAEKVFRPWWDTLEAGPHDFLLFFLASIHFLKCICSQQTARNYVPFSFRTICLTPLFFWVSLTNIGNFTLILKFLPLYFGICILGAEVYFEPQHLKWNTMVEGKDNVINLDINLDKNTE